MKRIVYGFLATLMIATTLLTGIEPASAHSSAPLEKTLYAGQNTPVGKVQVWNDNDHLYVKYLIIEHGWSMTESHLFVGPLNMLPKNFAGQPIVGHFPFDEDHMPAVTTYTYKIDKDDIHGLPNIVIAAHAKVQHKSTVTVAPYARWYRGSEDNVPSWPGYGGQWTYANAIQHFPVMNAVVWDTSLYDTINPVVPGVQYASWLYNATDPNGGSYAGKTDLRLFKTQVYIPRNFEVLEASLGVKGYTNRIPINDNVYVYVNKDLLFWGGTRANVIGTHEGMAGIQTIGYNSGAQKETDGWYIPGTFPEIHNLKSGYNTIEVFTEENERWGGMGKLMLTLKGIKTDRVESAWAEGTRISPRGNWGTYFSYTWMHIPVKVLYDTVTVLPNGSVVSSKPLVQGVKYLLETGGTYRFVDWGVNGIADAKFSLRIPSQVPVGYNQAIAQWVDGQHLPGAWKNFLQIWVDNAPANWEGAYNPDHLYTKTVTGDNTPLDFKILDSYYPDNSGSLTVRVYRIS